jgi:hypothetical protein
MVLLRLGITFILFYQALPQEPPDALSQQRIRELVLDNPFVIPHRKKFFILFLRSGMTRTTYEIR